MTDLLLGGGLDSVAYLILLNREIDKCVWIDYGQISSKGELKACEYFCNFYNKELIVAINTQVRKYNTCSMLFTGDLEDDPFLIGRNLSLIMTAFEYSKNVMLGFTDPGYEPFEDANSKFLIDLNNLLERVMPTYSIVAPLIHNNRKEVMKQAYCLNNSLFDKSFTCWISNSTLECGICKHCNLKKKLIEEVV